MRIWFMDIKASKNFFFRYVEKDLQDFLAMAALQFVVKLLDCEQKQDVAPIMEDIEALNKELDEYLKRV